MEPTIAHFDTAVSLFATIAKYAATTGICVSIASFVLTRSRISIAMFIASALMLFPAKFLLEFEKDYIPILSIEPATQNKASDTNSPTSENYFDQAPMSQDETRYEERHEPSSSLLNSY